MVSPEMATVLVQGHVRVLTSLGNNAAELHLHEGFKEFPSPHQPVESPLVSFQEQFSSPQDV